jgi:O-antigen biosynthesis protein
MSPPATGIGLVPSHGDTAGWYVPPANAPLVSCVMPTRGRPGFVAQSIRYFQRQDWPERELVIIHEDAADLPATIDDPRVRCIRVLPGTILGAKRNEAVRQARGEFIAHWDDDDWYGEQRLSRQLAPLLQGMADVSALNELLLLSLARGEFWAPTPALFNRMFVQNVSGGTLVFRRELWQRHGPYPDISLREDADFLMQLLQGGARLCRVPGRELCVYVRHEDNTWKFREGRYLQEGEWAQVPAPAWLAGDLEFYFPKGAPAPQLPLVSCIMPTADRRQFIPGAIRNYLEQDYSHRELIVLDDGRDSVADLMPQRDDIRYVRLDRKASIGAKRNIACELARGDLIAHWDDDDWMAPGWLRSQVQVLTTASADVCGLDKVFFYRPEARQAWQYVWDGQARWVCGGTLCYRREFWRTAPFPDVGSGEDNAFVWRARPERVAVNADHHLYVARVHAGNSSPKATSGRRWRACPVEQVERLLRGAGQPAHPPMTA